MAQRLLRVKVAAPLYVARVTTEGKRIPSGYLPFLTRIFYRPRKNNRLRVMFSTGLYVYPTATRLFNNDEAVLKKILKYSSLEHTVGMILQSPSPPPLFSCYLWYVCRSTGKKLSFELHTSDSDNLTIQKFCFSNSRMFCRIV
ncbi:hypothetical protein TNCV_39461 [Trichonephila clavipes]|nr:hypothetical protein TNCV_39461 [Trichonephila clavipes]